MEELFQQQGGEFISPPSVLSAKLGSIRAVLFDWDGVFNDGFKQGGEGSPFSEVDAMGTNLLRFALWKKLGQQAKAGIITGENNPPAVSLATREHMHDVVTLAKFKRKAFELFCKKHTLSADQVMFFFDDVLDLEVAGLCGVRMMISRTSSPLLRNFVKQNGLADYLTAHSGGMHGLREACELSVGLMGVYDDVVRERMTFANSYQTYLADRQRITTETWQG